MGIKQNQHQFTALFAEANVPFRLRTMTESLRDDD
jgi:hypothetical protein